MAKTNTKQKLLDYIQSNGEVSPRELSEYLEISPQALFRHIKTLIHQNKIKKIGSSPKVFYKIIEFKQDKSEYNVEKEDILLLENHFFFVSPIGERYSGLDAMINWCNRQNLPLEKTIDDYKKTLKKYNSYKKNYIIDGIQKLKSTFKDVYLNRLFYLDFYAIERFGKTKLGYFLLYSKQGQSMSFMNELILHVKPKIELLIKSNSFDAIAFTPPTVKRDHQIIKMLEKNCNFGLKVLKIEKLKTPIIVPQKTLSKLDDRILNAQNTMLVTEKNSFNHVLLIDDAVGSGATLNEIAKQMKNKNIAKKITGLALVGSFKGFDIISEI
jgi:DNA-binding Lrp family transcriptional regulator